MVYYYVLDVSQAKLYSANEKYSSKDVISDDITNYVVDKGLKSLHPKYIKRLAESKRATFKEVLCDVFVSYLDMEHEVTRNICPGKKYKRTTQKFSNSFIEQYTKDVSKYLVQNMDDKCWTLNILHYEDSNNMYNNHDRFLAELKSKAGKNTEELDDENNKEKKYIQAVIMLDDDYEYLGHVYLWSWLSSHNEYYGDLFMLDFISIRTSIKNLITKRVKNISSLLINIIAEWGSKYGWKYLHVAADPLGPMQDNLNKCGFGPNNIIKIDEIKCPAPIKIQQIDEKTDKYSYLSEDGDMETWYLNTKKRDDYLLKSLWFSYDIACELHRLYLLTYPDRIPSKIQLEYLYITTFRTRNKGLKVISKDIPFEKIEPKSLSDYKRLYYYIDNLPEVDDKRDLERWLELYSKSSYFVEELEGKLKGLNNIMKNLASTLTEFNEITKPGDKNYQEYTLYYPPDSYGIPSNHYTHDYDVYAGYLKDIFILKCKYNEFISWYKNLIWCCNNGVHLKYSYADVGSLMGKINELFLSTKLEGGTKGSFKRWRGTEDIVDIMKIYIRTP